VCERARPKGPGRTRRCTRTTQPAVSSHPDNSAISFGRMDHPRHAADLYETPPEAIGMLLRRMTLGGPVLEPSAGRGATVRELRWNHVVERFVLRRRSRCGDGCGDGPNLLVPGVPGRRPHSTTIQSKPMTGMRISSPQCPDLLRSWSRSVKAPPSAALAGRRKLSPIIPPPQLRCTCHSPENE